MKNSFNKIFIDLIETIFMFNLKLQNNNTFQTHLYSPKILEKYFNEYFIDPDKFFKPVVQINSPRISNFKQIKNSIIKFNSEFIPNTIFSKKYGEFINLHSIYLHKINYSKETKRAILYIHGWGKKSLKSDYKWHFRAFSKSFKSDIFALELPYHMNRNPFQNSTFI